MNKTSKLSNRKLGVIFDFNGVMIDDYQLQKEAWSQLAKQLGSTITDTEMYQIRGIPAVETVRRLCRQKNFSEDQITALAKQKDLIIQKLFRDSPLAKLSNGLTGFLNDLKNQHIPMTIVSSANLKDLQIIFERFNLFRWFDIQRIVHKDTTLGGDKIKNKPEPDPYLAGAKIIGIEPERCIVFEDAKSGIESAKRAGIGQIIAVNTNPAHLRDLTRIPGIIRGVGDFSEISVDFLYQNQE